MPVVCCYSGAGKRNNCHQLLNNEEVNFERHIWEFGTQVLNGYPGALQGIEHLPLKLFLFLHKTII